MRLLLTTDTIGGVWTFTSELSAELLSRGHHVALVSFGKAPSTAQSAWVAEQAGVYPNHFDFTASEVALEWMQGNGRALADGEPVLAAVAERFQPHLLLSSQFCFGAVSLRLPRIVVAHSDVLGWARAANPSALTPSPWLNHYTSLVQMGLLQADAVVAPTRWMLNALTPNFFLPAAGTVIPNGVRVTPADGPVGRKLQAVTAGRLWDEAKGLHILSQCHLPLPVLVAGDASSQHSGETAPSTALQFTGPLAARELHQLFRQSAIYLCTSVYEPFGLAPLEAALCGCAVLARDLPSLREVWGEDVLYFADAEDLTSQLRGLVDDPVKLADAQIWAQRHASRYTVQRMTDAYLALFDTVLHKPRAMPHVA